MNDQVMARPCPLCEVLAQGADVVLSIYRPAAFRAHLLAAHPGFDPASVWDMPLPVGGRAAKEAR